LGRIGAPPIAEVQTGGAAGQPGNHRIDDEQVLRNAGCPVRVIGKHPDKLAMCEKWQIRSRPLAPATLPLIFQLMGRLVFGHGNFLGFFLLLIFRLSKHGHLLESRL
jgi:hypothetical protein